MATLSSLGLSGLPLNDLLRDLRTAEEAPLSLLKSRKTIYETKISGYGMIKSSLSSLQTSLKTLGETATFSSLQASSSNTTSLTASVAKDGNAVAGVYTVKVHNLATTQSLVSAGHGEPSKALNNTDVTLNITVGGEVKQVTIAAADTSLQGIRAAINKADIGVSATILNNGQTEDAHQLIFSTTKTGEAASITKISVEGSDPTVDGVDLKDLLSYEDEPFVSTNPMAEKATAKDAALTINGIEVKSGSNTIADAIEGVSITLAAPTAEDAPLTLRVSENTSAVSTAITTFITAYNSLNATIGKLTSFNVAEGTSSVLTGDRVPRSIQTQMRSVLGSLAGEGGIKTLSQLGITTNVDTGALEINTEKLNKALGESKDDVVAFFTGENGLSSRLNTHIDDILSGNGLISNATKGMEKSIKTVEEQALSMTTRIDGTMARYKAQFTQLETFMSKMNGTSSYLSTQLGMLEAMGKSSSK